MSAYTHPEERAAWAEAALAAHRLASEEADEETPEVRVALLLADVYHFVNLRIPGDKDRLSRILLQARRLFAEDLRRAYDGPPAPSLGVSRPTAPEAPGPDDPSPDHPALTLRAFPPPP